MFYIACTRFNNTTYKENIEYRDKHDEDVIYGASLKIRHIYSPGSLIFVAEMNNEKNKIEGIGLIKNTQVLDRRHKIYDNSDYNRYIYRGKYWLSREELDKIDTEITDIFDNILFKGKSHLKCRLGITILTDKLFSHWDYELRILKNKVKCAFLQHFKNSIDFEPQEDTKEIFEIIPKPKKIYNKVKL